MNIILKFFVYLGKFYLIEMKNYLLVLVTEAETGRIFYSPLRPAPPLIFIFRPRPASPRKKLSPLRPAPLCQGIFINSTDTKDRNGKDFLLPTPLRPEKSFPRLAPPRRKKFYPPRPAPPKKVFPASPRPAKNGPRPVSVSGWLR
jgi:hypothetical protein